REPCVRGTAPGTYDGAVLRRPTPDAPRGWTGRSLSADASSVPRVRGGGGPSGRRARTRGEADGRHGVRSRSHDRRCGRAWPRARGVVPAPVLADDRAVARVGSLG